MSGFIVRYVGVIAVVAGFTTALALWSPSAPQVVGWSNFMLVVSANPFSALPAWPEFHAPNTTAIATGIECAWWDLPCHSTNAAASLIIATAWIAAAIIYLALLGFTIAIGIVAFLAWFFLLLASFFILLIGAGTLTMTNLPTQVQWLLWSIIVPFWTAVILKVISIIAGLRP